MKMILLVLTFLISQTANAMNTPGSVWSSIGTTPIEPNNTVGAFHFDQGAVVGHIGKVEVIPYVGFNFVKDSLGLSWNNKVETEAGVKLNKEFENGNITLGVAYGVEHQYKSSPDITSSSFIGSTTGWFGYQALRKVETPGSIWWMVGNTDLTEDTNLIGVVRVEQGITVTNVKSSPVDAVAWGQVGFDTLNRPWNNRYTTGGGLRISFPFSNGVASLTGGYECTTSPSEDLRLCGPTIKFNLWAGWNKF
jgi:hypothetical protein